MASYDGNHSVGATDTDLTNLAVELLDAKKASPAKISRLVNSGMTVAEIAKVYGVPGYETDTDDTGSNDND